MKLATVQSYNLKEYNRQCWLITYFKEILTPNSQSYSCRYDRITELMIIKKSPQM